MLTCMTSFVGVGSAPLDAFEISYLLTLKNILKICLSDERANVNANPISLGTPPAVLRSSHLPITNPGFALSADISIIRKPNFRWTVFNTTCYIKFT